MLSVGEKTRGGRHTYLWSFPDTVFLLPHLHNWRIFCIFGGMNWIDYWIDRAEQIGLDSGALREVIPDEWTEEYGQDYLGAYMAVSIAVAYLDLFMNSE